MTFKKKSTNFGSDEENVAECPKLIPELIGLNSVVFITWCTVQQLFRADIGAYTGGRYQHSIQNSSWDQKNNKKKEEGKHPENNKDSW